jgi:hypothetical protein
MIHEWNENEWDDWAEDEPEWWLKHPLHHPRRGPDRAPRQPWRAHPLAALVAGRAGV